MANTIPNLNGGTALTDVADGDLIPLADISDSNTAKPATALNVVSDILGRGNVPTATIAGDVTVTDGKLSTTESANSDLSLLLSTHASFTSDVVVLAVDRSASSGYEFLSAYSGWSGSADKEFSLAGDGNGTCDGSWTGGGADASEAMEWSDGNPDNQDRCGWAVVPDTDALSAAIEKGIYGKKYIRKAEAGETPIGIVSGNPGVRMGHGLNYQGKYLRDKFSRPVFENYRVFEWVDEDENLHRYASNRLPKGLDVPYYAKVVDVDDSGNKLTRRVLNPDYDPEREHESRENRKEWCDVNIAGFSPVLDDQEIDPRWANYGKCGDGVTLYLVR